MKRFFSIVFLAVLLTTAIAVPASAQYAPTEDDDSPWTVLSWEHNDTQAELAACLAEAGVYSDAFVGIDLGNFVEKDPNVWLDSAVRIYNEGDIELAYCTPYLCNCYCHRWNYTPWPPYRRTSCADVRCDICRNPDCP